MPASTDDGHLRLAKDIYDVAHLTGTFELRSGRVTDEYFDKYRFEAEPKLLDRIAAAMVELIPPNTEVLAGLEMGGVPIVTALSRHADLPAAFVRKVAKPHGTKELAEGARVDGRRVLVVEDVVTSGGQIAASTADLRRIGAQVDEALCVLDRESGGSEALAESGIRLLSLFTRSDIAYATEDRERAS